MSEEGYRVPDVCRIVGISYRQLDYWARTELVTPSIRDAHGAEEKVSLSEVASAVGVYVDLVRGLLTQGEACLAPRR